MRKQYHPRRTADELHVRDVHRLVRLPRNLAPSRVPLSKVAEIDGTWWYAETAASPNSALAGRPGLVLDVDMSHPVILCADGRLLDRMHRVSTR